MCLLVLGLCCFVLFCSVHVFARVFLFERQRENESSGFLWRGVEATRWREVDDTRQSGWWWWSGVSQFLASPNDVLGIVSFGW